MSIINEALKKAQQEKKSQPFARPLPSAELQYQKKHGMNWGPIFVLAVLFLIAGPILLPLLFNPFRQNAYTAPVRTIVTGKTSVPDAALPTSKLPPLEFGGATRKAQFDVEESMKPPAFPARAAVPSEIRGRYVLSGIVYSPKDSYCIINDEVVKAGERVGGATLVEITSDKVTLDYQGNLISLVQ